MEPTTSNTPYRGFSLTSVKDTLEDVPEWEKMTPTERACHAVLVDGALICGENKEGWQKWRRLTARKPFNVAHAVKKYPHPQRMDHDRSGLEPEQPGYCPNGALMLASRWRMASRFPAEDDIALFFLLRTVRTDLTIEKAEEYAREAAKAADEARPGLALAYACEALGVPLPTLPPGWEDPEHDDGPGIAAA